jgi:hypothetical protein
MAEDPKKMTQLGFLFCLTELLVAPVISATMRHSTRARRANGVLILGSLLVG